MKKLMLIISIMSISLLCLANNEQRSFRIGFYNPQDSKAGLMLGGTTGIDVDERVEINFSGDFFIRNYTDDKDINVQNTVGGNEIVTVLRTADISTYYIPIMGNVKIKIPYTENIVPYAGGGIGYAMAWEDIFIAADTTANSSKIDDVNFYHGFAGNVNLGVNLPLGSKSNLYLETFYNWSVCKRNKKENATGITWDELNMSGTGIRLGLAINF